MHLLAPADEVVLTPDWCTPNQNEQALTSSDLDY
jgi:hypothetical protein